MLKRSYLASFAVATILALAACGGGTSVDEATPPQASPQVAQADTAVPTATQPPPVADSSVHGASGDRASQSPVSPGNARTA